MILVAIDKRADQVAAVVVVITSVACEGSCLLCEEINLRATTQRGADLLQGIGRDLLGVLIASEA